MALIIGGYYSPDGVNTVQQSVELFGCNNRYTVPIEDYPETVYLPGATYQADEDRVLCCGGFTCPDGPTGNNCEIRDECHYWSAVSGLWDDGETAPSLANGKRNFFMAQAVNIETASDARVPLALGNGPDTEIFDVDNDQWIAYKEMIENNWVGLGCLVQNEDIIYHIRLDVQTLDTTTWEFVTIDDALPDAMATPFRCSYTTIDGDAGIFTRYGYFYNLNSGEWEKKAIPPYDRVAGLTNSMFTFQGKPTVFGVPSCKSEGVCTYRSIIQYNPDNDEWVNIGEMRDSRRFHTVVAMPSSVCDNFDLGSTPDPMTTLGQGADPESSLGQRAALVIGGQKDAALPNSAISTVELFGCPNTNQPIYVKDFPTSIYYSGGALMPDGSRVLVCGGFGCNNDASECNTKEECYYWNPTFNSWDNAPSLTEPRDHFIMTFGPDVNRENSGSQLPTIIGGGSTTTMILNGNRWSNYEELPTVWYSDNCLFQDDGLIYYLRDDMIELNPYTWNQNNLGPMVRRMNNLGQCTPVHIDGELGAMMTTGDWISLRSLEWNKLAVPPLDPIGRFPNSLFLFGGQPTIFGSGICDSVGECEYSQVLQFDQANNAWLEIGTLGESRIEPFVIDVPVEFCNPFVDGSGTTPGNVYHFCPYLRQIVSI